MNKSISIVVPAYNEEENIIQLIHRIHQTLYQKFEYEIIIIDDNSSDETFSKGNSLADTYPVRMYKKEGERGKTYSLLQGFSLAKYNYIGMIDADLQYPPEALVDMINALDDFDVQVANRKDQQIPFHRQISSKLYSVDFGKWLLGLPYDIQSGLKVFKKEVLEVVDINPDQWGFDYQFLYYVKNNNFKIGQTNITFASRQFGISKISSSAYIELLLGIITFRLKRIQLPTVFRSQVSMFAAIGVLNTVIDFSITLSLSYFLQATDGVSLIMINTFAFSIALINSYFLNKTFTFNDNDTTSVSKVIKYSIVSILSLVLSNIVLYAFTSIIMYPISILIVFIGKIFATLVSMVSNYLGYQYLVFKRV